MNASKRLDVVVEEVTRIIHEIRSWEKVGCVELMTQKSIIVLCVHFVDSSRLDHSEGSQFSSDFSRYSYQCPCEYFQ